MTNFEQLQKDGSLGQWEREPPATIEEIQVLQKAASIQLPIEYLKFFQFSNGAYGELPVQPYWCCLFKASDVLQNNLDYEINSYLPGYFAIGTDGGSEILLFDTSVNPWSVVAVDAFGDGPEDAIKVADSFNQFVTMIGREANFEEE